MKRLLETIDLRKTYRVGKIGVEALRGVSLRIREGELAAIMGPSGCGKSTLMHVLGAMTKASSGTVLINGRDIAGMNDGNDDHLAEIIKLLMIEDKMARRPFELSGGEQQRVAIARAVANKPAI